MIELTTAQLWTIILVCMFAGGVIVEATIRFLAWTDARQQAKARAEFLADERRDGDIDFVLHNIPRPGAPVRLGDGGVVYPTEDINDMVGRILDDAPPPMRWSDYARERDHLVSSMDEARLRQETHRVTDPAAMTPENRRDALRKLRESGLLPSDYAAGGIVNPPTHRTTQPEKEGNTDGQ